MISWGGPGKDLVGRPGENVFERTFLPHLDAAYNLARWLTRSEQDAEDVVQEAYLRALRFFGSFRGGDGRAWLLAIVRNASHDWLRRTGTPDTTTPFDEEIHGTDDSPETPEMLLIQQADRDLMRREIEMLPLAWREVLILREFEGLSYKEIAGIAGIPIGTVMSRLARARARLHDRISTLQAGARQEAKREVR